MKTARVEIYTIRSRGGGASILRRFIYSRDIESNVIPNCSLCRTGSAETVYPSCSHSRERKREGASSGAVYFASEDIGRGLATTRVSDRAGAIFRANTREQNTVERRARPGMRAFSQSFAFLVTPKVSRAYFESHFRGCLRHLLLPFTRTDFARRLHVDTHAESR